MAVGFLTFARSPKLQEDFAVSFLKENEVTTGYVPKKLTKRSYCKNYKILLKAKDVDIANNHN